MSSKTVIAGLSAVAATAGVLIGVTAASSGSSAATSCTAWATLPARVSLADHPVTVHMTLRGSAGCHVRGSDNGATANLRGPGANDPQRWSKFGSQDTQTFQLRVNRLGTYTLRNGDVQVYNSSEERVPAHWRTTSVVVKRATRVRDLHRSGGRVSGVVQSYGNSGWGGQQNAHVVLQKRTHSGWQPAVQEHAKGGRFVFTGAKSGTEYRVVADATRTTVSSTSHRV